MKHKPIKTRHAREKYLHPYKACFVPISNRCGTLHSTPNGAQRPRWHIDPEPALIPFVKSQAASMILSALASRDADHSVGLAHSPSLMGLLLMRPKLIKMVHARERYPHPYKAARTILSTLASRDADLSAGSHRPILT
ncbi:hypothetical protein PIB30_020009 [Stylosanthes scabra]|uniref:Uncharacterized protein n=1 Tax=Stylosanthes scabra TaxID=79078 RepID=A0ABU6Q883_9FABA|nr:hypothetical protein [Stylosanthes scabra]